MSSEETKPQESQAEGDGGLGETLSESEQGFVTEEEAKPAVNKGMLIVLGLSIAGAAAYYVPKLTKSDASAANGATVQTSQADETINTFLNSGPDKIKSMQKMLHETDKVVEQFKTYPNTTQVPLNDLKTNPFKLDTGKGSAEEQDAASAKRREQDRQAALKGVQGLQLQSILHGARKACMINNGMYTEGQQVEGFTVEKIAPGSVVVRNGQFRFELKMQK